MPTIDLGGNDLRVRSIQSGYQAPGQNTATTTQAAGATYTLTDKDLGKMILLDTAAGSVVTLPAATGSGKTFRFIVSTLATSNSHVVKVANANDSMLGMAIFADTDGTAAVNAFVTVNSGTQSTNSDTITLNRTTTGSVTLGEYIECIDYAPNKWRVECFLSNTSTPATPFSAAV